MRTLLVVATAAVIGALAGCPSGGDYVSNTLPSRTARDRGDTNGRTFDFVSNKPDGDEWTIRLRGTSMFASYARADKIDKLGGPVGITDDESAKVWRLVDALDLERRPKGDRDQDTGYVTLVLHEPGANETQADIYTVYVKRDTRDDGVIALASYLRELITKYKNETPNF